jgi:hypothetical protein
MSKGKVELVTGDDEILIHDIEKENITTGQFETFDVPTNSVVKSRLISLDHKTYYTNEVAQVSTTTGADWANSRIAAKFNESDTLGINDIVGELWKNGKLDAKLETQINNNGKKTYFANIVMVKGSIS